MLPLVFFESLGRRDPSWSCCTLRHGVLRRSVLRHGVLHHGRSRGLGPFEGGLGRSGVGLERSACGLGAVVNTLGAARIPPLLFRMVILAGGGKGEGCPIVNHLSTTNRILQSTFQLWSYTPHRVSGLRRMCNFNNKDSLQFITRAL